MIEVLKRTGPKPFYFVVKAKNGRVVMESKEYLDKRTLFAGVELVKSIFSRPVAVMDKSDFTTTQEEAPKAQEEQLAETTDNNSQEFSSGVHPESTVLGTA